jgi:hypothetical protein
MVMYSLKKIVVAIIVAYPALALAQNNTQLKAELDALKLHVQKLEAMMEKMGAQASAAQATAQPGALPVVVAAEPVEMVDVAEFNRLRVKTDALEDANEASGFKGVKISGYIDPTYIYNRNAKTSSFSFLNHNSDINGSGEGFGYDNSFFGSGMLNFEKELEGGTKFKMTLMPSKSTASGYNFGNLVHEASVSIPLVDANTRLIAGQMPDWTGYEAIPSNLNKLITHNLLFDFSAANFYTGAGVELLRGKWSSKIMVGNLNRARIDASRQQAPGLFYRADYAYGEFSGIGFSGIHAGFDDKEQFGRTDMVEVDGFFTRGALNLQGQLSYGRQSATDGNGYRSDGTHWFGLSTLASYKVAPRLEAITRFDFIANKNNGGGVFGSTLNQVMLEDGTNATYADGTKVAYPDGRNGFGPGMVYDGANWVVLDPSTGSNRYALALGLNYLLMPGVNLKGEYRYDRSSNNVFKNADENYVRDNHVLAVSTVVSF